MSRLVLLASVIAACSDSRPSVKDAPPPPADVAVVFDAPPPPPPSHDAAPPPMMSCTADAGTACELPPSRCLDANYLVYYTAGTCESGSCQYTYALMYCGTGLCSDNGTVGGCLGGFT